jgi:ADP-heptose:LPS heptosyltransferase
MKLPADINKIIVFRALQLGDMLCFVPAMRALRKTYPNAHIALAGLPWAKSFTDRFNEYFDEFIWFPGYPGLPEQTLNPVEFSKFLTNIQQQQFDLALQMQGNGYLVNPMVELFNAKYTAGFCKPEDYTPNANYFLPYPNYGHEAERHLLLMNFLGIASDGNELEFPLAPSDQAEFDKINLPIEPKNYVCIHPGSRGSWRQWPVEHFAAIADHCITNGYKAVITGTKDEEAIVNEVIAHMKYEAINTTGKTSLGAIGVLIKNAAALISNCTGVSHMAAAFKTPSIVISMDGEPERWGPINKQIHRTINWLDNPGYENVLQQTDSLLHQFNKA